jgi:DNA polymerase I
VNVWLGIDGTNWIHALYHALRGQDVLRHFCRRAKILADFCQADRILLCFDRRSFRHNLLPSYKANRHQKEAALVRLLEGAPAASAEVGQPVYEDGFEADDCLATLARQAELCLSKLVIASPDKDLYQCLVDGRVSILRLFATKYDKIASPEWMTARELEIAQKTNGLRPACWADYQSLVGQPGDNVPGCPGWGEQTARRALAKAGSLDAMLSNPWSIDCSKSQLTKLQAWAKGDMPLVRRLVTLRTDVSSILDALR